MTQPAQRLDPVTFEVIKNGLASAVDQMAEQILRTCHSFVIYCHDFSSALCDAQGNTVAQGSQDISVHVGTLHFTARAILDAFSGDINPGDVFAVNDPYLGGTHFSDVRILRPVFHSNELLAFTQSNGHWADIGGSVPGSFDITAKEHFGEGLRITPLRLVDRGVLREDVVRMIISNTRAPEDCRGDLEAQITATAVAEAEVLRLVGRYGVDTVRQAFGEVQDYVERLARQRVAALPDGTWEAVDYIDFDPNGEEGLVPIRVKLTIDGDQLRYDLTGSHPAIGTFLNSSAGASFSAVVAGTKTFFPDIPLNSGFYRVLDVNLGPEGSVVNAVWPTAVTGFCAGPFEKIMNAIFQIWSQIIPERAIACSFNLEYLLVGGWDHREDERSFFMWYDWMAGGWGGRNELDGSNATSPVFGPGLAVQPLEGQERLCPVLTTGHEIRIDSGGPGRWRGGCGVEKGGVLTAAQNTVMSYSCDRARSVTWGIGGGLPSLPHGTWLTRKDGEPEFLGASFSSVSVGEGDLFTRPSAGGGGFGDPLERDPRDVCEDVADGYVSLERATQDYGVVVREVDVDLAMYEVDVDATARERAALRAIRRSWLTTDPEDIAARYRIGELDVLDVVRRYGVILDWGTGELLARTTETYREAVSAEAARQWSA
ncbi:hydantoinase B/oxoprolinase family protein [Nocardia sp. NPDC059246]|uniref:hydantoinase B/oxoprolinase family protein n=1 Tax=unclassified Nocardia TaxID=2637762 RepID=UPI003692F92C